MAHTAGQMVNPASRTSAGVRNPTRVRTSRQLRTGRTAEPYCSTILSGPRSCLAWSATMAAASSPVAFLLMTASVASAMTCCILSVPSGGGELLLGLEELRLVAVGLDVAEVVTGGGGPDSDRVLGHELTAGQPLDQLEGL